MVLAFACNYKFHIIDFFHQNMQVNVLAYYSVHNIVLTYFGAISAYLASRYWEPPGAVLETCSELASAEYAPRLSNLLCFFLFFFERLLLTLQQDYKCIYYSRNIRTENSNYYHIVILKFMFTPILDQWCKKNKTFWNLPVQWNVISVSICIIQIFAATNNIKQSILNMDFEKILNHAYETINIQVYAPMI